MPSAEQRQGLASVVDIIAELKYRRHEVLTTDCFGEVSQAVVPMNSEVANWFELFQQTHMSSEDLDTLGITKWQSLFF
ncbi:MAG: hypothetical protein AAFY20_19765 [Cyanobacteria bacterium J06639_14]